MNKYNKHKIYNHNSLVSLNNCCGYDKYPDDLIFSNFINDTKNNNKKKTI